MYQSYDEESKGKKAVGFLPSQGHRYSVNRLCSHTKSHVLTPGSLSGFLGLKLS